MDNLYKINKTLFENIINKGFTSFTDVQKTVIDKKNVLLADETLNITKDIMSLLNQKLKSIKID